jgi:hypothetical protein
MSERSFRENWSQLMGGADELMDELRRGTDIVGSSRARELLAEAEQHRSAAEHALRSFVDHHATLLRSLDALQTELAIAGGAPTGEIS